MIYRPDEDVGPGPDSRTNREIIAGLLAMAFLLATLASYTSNLWCGAAPWLCLDSLRPVVEAGPTATPLARGSEPPGADSPAGFPSHATAWPGLPSGPSTLLPESLSATPTLGLVPAPDPSSDRFESPTFEFATPGATFATPGATFATPGATFATPGATFATPTSLAVISPRRVQMTTTAAAAAATFESAARGGIATPSTFPASATGAPGDPYPSAPATGTSTLEPTDAPDPYP